MLIVSLILLQVIIFVILIFVFRRILTQNVVSATKHLDVLNEDFSRKEQELNKQTEESKQKSEELLVKARDEAEKLKDQIVKEAESKRDKILDEARNKNDEIIQQAEKSRQLLISELEERIAKESINKACELVQVTLPDEFKQTVHAQYVEELIEGGFKQLERLRIPGNVKEIKIASAFPLKGKQREGLLKKLKGLIPQDVKIEEEVDSKIVSGLVITIGSLVLDGSLKNKIKEGSKNLDTGDKK